MAYSTFVLNILIIFLQVNLVAQNDQLKLLEEDLIDIFSNEKGKSMLCTNADGIGEYLLLYDSVYFESETHRLEICDKNLRILPNKKLFLYAGAQAIVVVKHKLDKKKITYWLLKYDRFIDNNASDQMAVVEFRIRKGKKFLSSIVVQ